MIFAQLNDNLVINVARIEYIKYNYISHETRHKDHMEDAFILIIKFSGERSVNLYFKNRERADHIFKFIRRMMAEQFHVAMYMKEEESREESREESGETK
jgi:hypothetical protein